MPEVYLEPYQRSRMEFLAKIVNADKAIFLKLSIFDVWQGSDYGSLG